MEKQTLFTIESKRGLTTWYIDYDPEEEYSYSLHKDEKWITSRKTLGEILEIAFNKFGSVNLKLL